MSSSISAAVYRPTTMPVDVKEAAAGLISIVVDAPAPVAEIPLLTIARDASDAGPEASAFIDEVSQVLSTEATKRYHRERRCQRILVALHAAITLMLAAGVISAAATELLHLLPPTINVSVSMAVTGLNVALLHVVRRVAAAQKQHHHIFVESSSLHSRLAAKRSYFLADGVISGREFNELQTEFVEYTRRCRAIQAGAAPASPTSTV